MLDSSALDSSALDSAGLDSAGLDSRGRQRGVRLYFAGVAFSLHGSAALLGALERLPCAIVAGAASLGEALGQEALRQRVWEHASLPVCDVTLERSGSFDSAKLDPARERAIDCSWQAGVCSIQTRGARASLGRAGPSTESGRWSAHAEVSLRAGALEALLTALASALLYRRGGAVLHASSVELAGGVVAFVGPSGAGKSTASRHAAAPLFSIDRLALAPVGRGWVAYALPGGTPQPQDGAASACLGLPLLGIARVFKAAEGCSLRAVAPSRSLALVRESVFQATRTPQAEAGLLTALAELCQCVPVRELHFTLGAALREPLESWLR